MLSGADTTACLTAKESVPRRDGSKPPKSVIIYDWSQLPAEIVADCLMGQQPGLRDQTRPC